MDSKTIRRRNLAILENDFRTLAAIERHTGGEVTASYLSQIKGGRGMGDATARKIEQMLGYPKGWMDVPHDDEMPVVETATGFVALPRRAQAHATSHSQEIVETVNIRRFDNPASLGAGIERHETDMLVGHMTVNAGWVRQNLPNITSPRHLEIMVGFGDSMAPTINDGDLVLVDRGIREVRIDAVYVFTLANELFIKTLQRIPGDGIKVISDNKKYDPYVLDSSSRKEMEILARVCWAWNGRKL